MEITKRKRSVNTVFTFQFLLPTSFVYVFTTLTFVTYTLIFIFASVAHVASDPFIIQVLISF